MRIVAIVPMRHNSERVPGKNYRDFAGEPLFHSVIKCLLSCPEIAEVVIDTDSQVIMKDVAATFPSVTLLERPVHLRGGAISMNDVLLHTTSCIDADWYLQTHSTNPLIQPATITTAIQTFMSEQGQFDSLFSVKRLQTRLWNADGSAINHDPNVLLRTQDLPPVYEENSCIYIFKREILVKRRNRIGERPLLFEMDPVESLDIDVESDFRIAELLFKESSKNGS